MRLMRKATAVGAVVAAVGAAIVTAAPASAAVTAPAPDGYVYAWQNINAGGYHCRWTGNDDNWSTCADWNGVGHNMRNQASSVQNKGFTHAVNFYYSPGQTGAWACLGVGDYWPALTREHFTRGHGLPGHGKPLNDDIASHKWLSSC